MAGWFGQNWKPTNWPPTNWDAPTHSAPIPSEPVRSAFLDRFGRFAKSEETVAEIRLWAEGADLDDFTSLTVAEFNALTRVERDAIRNMLSGAGYVDTAGKSNA